MTLKFSVIEKNSYKEKLSKQQWRFSHFSKPWTSGAPCFRWKDQNLCSVLSYYSRKLSGSFNWLKDFFFFNFWAKMYFIIVNYHNNPRFEDLWVAQQSSGKTKENILYYWVTFPTHCIFLSLSFPHLQTGIKASALPYSRGFWKDWIK